MTKTLPWILAGLLAVAALIGWMRPQRQQADAVVIRRDTLIVRDTLRDTIPRALLVRFDHWDTVPFPVTVHDTLYLPLPIERREYRTDDYHAVITGYRPRLELMELFRQTKTVTLTPRPRRWGLGLQTGVGYPSGWYVGLGLQYDLWQW